MTNIRTQEILEDGSQQLMTQFAVSNAQRQLEANADEASQRAEVRLAEMEAAQRERLAARELRDRPEVIVKGLPLGSRVLMRAAPSREKSKGGIIIPELHQERIPIFEAEIVAVGPQVSDSRLAPGTAVLVEKHQCVEYQFNDASYWVADESSIHLMLERTANK